MNAPVPATAMKLSPLEQFKAEVLPPERKRELFSALPAHVKPERFERNLINALMQNPDLLKCDPRLVYREVSKVAALGLLLDPQLGEAYMILGWNGKAQRNEPQVRIGYRGLIKLARQSGEIAGIYAHEVCANDEIECVLGDEKRLVHRPDLFGDRGPVVGYYAVVKYKDGDTDFEPMTIDQVHEIRERSDGWKAFKNGKIKSTPWSTDEGEMAKKTVLRRILKRIPQSPELSDAIGFEDRAEHADFREITTRIPPASIPSAPRAPQLVHSVETPAEVDHVTREPVEEAEAVRDPAPDWQAEIARVEEDLAAAQRVEDVTEIADAFWAASDGQISRDMAGRVERAVDAALDRLQPKAPPPARKPPAAPPAAPEPPPTQAQDDAFPGDLPLDPAEEGEETDQEFMARVFQEGVESARANRPRVAIPRAFASDPEAKARFEAGWDSVKGAR